MKRLPVLACLVVVGIVGVGLLSGRLSSQGPAGAGRELLASLQAPPGFEITLAAAPPVVNHPTLVGLDDRGRLFVSENAGVNLAKAALNEQVPSTIRMLEDTNGDGVFDRSTVFADRMTFPQGALWHEGALYAASPPSMWRLEDTNGDGVADQRKEIATGFDFTGNAADIHGPFLSPTGRLFWCHGRKGHEVYDGTRLVSKALGARIWMSRPDGTGLEAFAGGGMDNPTEVTFTDEGDVFGTANLFHSAPRVDAIVHWVYGGTYPRADQEQVLAEFQRTGELLTPAVNLGHVAPAGIMRYRSRELGPSYQHNLFLAEFNTHRVMRVRLEPQGSTFTGRTETFLSSSDPDLHFTDVLEDADGSLLVVNTGGWFSNGCPTSGLAKPDVNGAIYRVRRTGGHKVADPRGLRINWADSTPSQLAPLLGDARFAVRDRAVLTIAHASDAAVPELTRTLGRSDRQARLGAVWALTRIDTPAARIAVRAALGDADPGVRQAGCRSIFTTRAAGAAPRLIQLLADAQAPVRREAAAALGRLDATSAVTALLDALAKPGNDRTLEHALTYALIEIDEPAATAAGLDRPQPTVRRAALIALDQMRSGALVPAQVFPLLDASEAPLRNAALMVIAGRRMWASAVAADLERRLGAGRLTPAQAVVARELLIKFGHEVGVRELAGRALARPDLPRDDRLVILTALADTPGLQFHPSWAAPMTSALFSDDVDVMSAAITTIRLARASGFDEALAKIGGDVRRDPLLRVAALQAMRGPANDPAAGAARGGVSASSMEAASFELAAGLFGSAAAVPARVQAAEMLARASLSPAQFLELARLIEKAGPMELQALTPVLAKSRDAAVGSAFLQTLAKSPGLFALTEGDIRRSFRAYPPEVVAASGELVRQLLQRTQNKDAHLTQLAAVLSGGDANRGRQAFSSGKGNCSLCHRIGATGGQVGPDLSTIGRIRDGHELLDAIAYPSDNIARGYDAYSVTMADGRTYLGTVQRETADTVYVTPFSGPPVALARDQVQARTPSPVSLMPTGLDALFSRQELGDLIAYLRSLK